jgi:hypothetical protein
MSNDTENTEDNLRTGSERRVLVLIAKIIAMVGGLAGIMLAFFLVYDIGYEKGRDVGSDSPGVELDSLKKITRADSLVVCVGRRTTFLNGRIVVGLHKVIRVWEQWPQASFRITDVITGEEYSFRTSDSLNHYEFRSGDEDYILYFDGYAKVEGETNYCAKIALRKKSHVGPEQGKQSLETNAPSPP